MSLLAIKSLASLEPNPQVVATIYKELCADSIDSVKLAFELMQKYGLGADGDYAPLVALKKSARDEERYYRIRGEAFEMLGKVYASLGASPDTLQSFPLIEAIAQREARMAMWAQDNTFLKSEFGHIGVYYAHGSDDVVVKKVNYPFRETFAARVIAHMGIATPEIRIVSGTSQEGDSISRAFATAQKSSVESQRANYFLLQERVNGFTFDELTSHHLLLMKDQIAGLLEEVGKIAAADLFLYYQDRLSHIGMSNMGNIMFVQDPKTKTYRVVAIDSSVEVGRSSVWCSRESKKQRVKEKIVELAALEDSQISSLIDDLLDGLPFDKFSQIIALADAKKAIQRGLIAGLKTIGASCQKARLEPLASDFPTAGIPVNELIPMDSLDELSQLIKTKFPTL